MDSFFSRVKSFFHQDFDGRYLGIIISNGFEEAPEPFLKFFKKHTTCRINLNAKSKYKLLCEFSFGSDNSKADLALFESGTSRPILVIELKFLDKFHKGKSTSAKLSQWDGYLKFCDQARCEFLAITKDPLDESEWLRLSKEKRSRHAFWGDLAAVLVEFKDPTTKLVVDYLRDLGVVMQPVDEKALYEFLHRILLPRGGTGKVINMTTFPAGPKQVSILLDNLRLAEQAFSSWIVPSLSRSATIDYQITSLYDVEKLTRGNLEHANDNTERLLPPRYRQGGHLEISAKSRIFKHTSLNYGFAFTVDRSKKNSVRVNSFASFRGSKFKRVEEQSGWAQSEENLTPSQVSQVFGPPLKSPPTVEHWTAILGKVVAANARLVLETKRSKDEETRKFVKEILKKC